METLLTETRGRALWITLNRPEARNAVSRRMNAELQEVWRGFAEDDALDVAVLTGAGDRAFCAGADLRDYIPRVLKAKPPEIRRNVDMGLGGITRGMHRIYKPMIAAVNGAALAGGFELALACDIRLASETAVFGSFEIRRGFHHGDGGVARLVASLGVSKASEIILTGREVPAQEAHALGLVAEVVAPEALEEAAERWASLLMSHSQVAVRSAKETIMEVSGRQIDDALRIDALYGYTSGDVDDIAARLEAFLDRPRAPEE
jgi:enoyl-CoA hydratase